MPSVCFCKFLQKRSELSVFHWLPFKYLSHRKITQSRSFHYQRFKMTRILEGNTRKYTVKGWMRARQRCPANVRDWGGLSLWLCFSVLRITIQSTNTIYTTLFNASSNKSYINKPINYWQLKFMICKTHFLYEAQWPGATLSYVAVQLHPLLISALLWRQVVSFSPRPVYSQWKTTRTHWGRSLVGRQHLSGHVIQENNILLLRGI
jgi:hypothetical protein